MSAIHRGYFDAHYGPNGALVIDGASNNGHDHAEFWQDADLAALNAVAAPADVETEHAGIPEQRAGDAYKAVVIPSKEAGQ